MNPKVSVITVSLNSAKTIERTIKSVIDQGYDNLEYIIIDGGSTDGTIDIIKKYESFITYWISEPDEGVYYAMNKGLKTSTGDYVIFLNSDDYFCWGALYNASWYLRESGADVLYGDVAYVHGNGKTEGVHAWPIESIRWCVPFCHQTVFMKRKKGVLFDTQFRIAADYNMLFRMYMEGNKFVYMPHTISFFSLSGISSDHYKANLEILDISCRIMLEHENDKHLYKHQIEKVLVDSINKHMYKTGENHDSILDFINSKIKKDTRIIIFGLGEIFEHIWPIVKKSGLNVDYLVDSNDNKWGSSIDGLKIQSPGILSDERNCVVFLMTERCVDEINWQLRGLITDSSVKILNYVQLMNEYYELSSNEIIESWRKKIPSLDRYLDLA